MLRYAAQIPQAVCEPSLVSLTSFESDPRCVTRQKSTPYWGAPPWRVFAIGEDTCARRLQASLTRSSHSMRTFCVLRTQALNPTQGVSQDKKSTPHWGAPPRRVCSATLRRDRKRYANLQRALHAMFVIDRARHKEKERHPQGMSLSLWRALEGIHYVKIFTFDAYKQA